MGLVVVEKNRNLRDTGNALTCMYKGFCILVRMNSSWLFPCFEAGLNESRAYPAVLFVRLLGVSGGSHAA